MIGTFLLYPATHRVDLLAEPVAAALTNWPSAAGSVETVQVAEIDPIFADTAEFCKKYDSPLANSANCVIVEAKRGNEVRYAACIVLATTRADINGFARRRLGARRASFAPVELAIQMSGMEYGGITPIGLPSDWPILVDRRVADTEQVVVGSGLRRSKLIVNGQALANLPSAETCDNLAMVNP